MQRIGTIVAGALLFCVSGSVVYAQSAAELQAELNALLQQLSVLQGQLKTTTGTANSIPQTTGVYGQCPPLVRTLRKGALGSDVTALQAFLAADASIYPEGTISGYFGVLTESAVKNFQSRHGIVASGSPDTTGWGIVGPATRAAIASICASRGGAPTPIPGTPTPLGSTCILGGAAVAANQTQRFYSVQQAPPGTTCAAYETIRQCVNGQLSGNAAYQYATCTNAAAPAPSSCAVNGVHIAHGTTFTFYKTQKVTTVGQTCANVSQSRTCQNGNLTGSPEYVFLSCTTDVPDSCVVGDVTVLHGKSRTFYRQDYATSTNSCSAYAQTRTCNDGGLSGDSAFNKPSCKAGVCEVNGLVIANGSSTSFYLAQNIPSSEQCSSYQQERTCSSGVMSGDAAYKYTACTPVASGTCVLDNVVVPSGSSGTFYSKSAAPAGQSCTAYRQVRTCTNGVFNGTATFNRASCSDTGSCSLDGVSVPHGESYRFYSAQTVAYGTTCSSKSLVRTCTNGALSGSATFKFGGCSVSPPTSTLPNAEQFAAALSVLESLLQSILREWDSLF